jgi:hypothetical protein
MTNKSPATEAAEVLHLSREHKPIGAADRRRMQAAVTINELQGQLAEAARLLAGRAERARQTADWFDLVDDLLDRLRILPHDGPGYDLRSQVARHDEAQSDLRAWAGQVDQFLAGLPGAPAPVPADAPAAVPGG